MRKLLLIIVTVIPVTLDISAQTIITEMDRVTYYNSLDTSVSAVFNKIAWLCNCYLLKNYPKSPVQIKLDMELSKDTMYYEVGYDNLYGNSGFPDTTGGGQNPADKIYFDLGLRIKACDTAISKENILRLLDYGMLHYEQLQTMRAEALAMAREARPRHCSIDEGSMQAILSKRVSLKIKDAIRYCR
ncbi:MAG TPA: hypothetical protein VLD19_18335 [Chitinophagaceae bacterium]|nr:hypothetical protein [Chitinophagaceae bacterium]